MAASSADPKSLWMEHLLVAPGGQKRLHGISLELSAGEHAAVIGPSGSGKTTLLRAISGLLPPSGGRLGFAGDTWHEGAQAMRAPESRRLGMVPQDLALWPHMTAAQHLDFVLRCRRIPRLERRRKTVEILETVELGALTHRKPSQLSGGEAQRLAIARALAGEPRLLLLDEPLGHLDEALRRPLARKLHEWAASIGAAALHVTHDINDALSHGNRILVLEGGTASQWGPPADLLDNPKTAFAARVTGRTNIVPKTRVAELLEVLPAAAGRGVRLLDGSLALSPADLALSPEGIAVRIESATFDRAAHGLIADWEGVPLEIATGALRCELVGGPAHLGIAGQGAS